MDVAVTPAHFIEDDELDPLPVMTTLKLAAAQLRLLAPSLRVEAEKVPAHLLGSKELSEQMCRVLNDSSAAFEALADDVDDLAAASRRCREQQRLHPVLRRPLNTPVPHCSGDRHPGER